MNVYEQIQRNKWKTALLMSLFIAVLVAIGFAWGEYLGTGWSSGVLFAVVISFVMALLSYFGGDKLALLTAGAKEIQKEDHPSLFRLVENVAITAGLSMPRVYIIADPAMNAFATGRDPKYAAVAFTTGIIEGLENEELEAVVAHELSHIRNYDTRLMMIVVVLVGAIALLADWMWRVHFFGGRRRGRGGGQVELIFAVVGIALIILSPIIAELIKLAISRRREYLADASAVLLTRYAEGLAQALQKISAQGGKLLHANHATAHLYFSNPFGDMSRFARLWSTHPPIEERIARLRAMAGSVPSDI